MLNLRKSAVNKYWEKKSKRIQRIIELMESMEDWMVDDHEEIIKALDKFGINLEKTKQEKLIKQKDSFLNLLAYLSSGRSLMIIIWIDQKFDGEIIPKIIEYAQEKKGENELIEKTTQLLIDRLNTLNSLELLGQIFSPTRLEMIEKILKIGIKN